jgi:hypothetical protein
MSWRSASTTLVPFFSVARCRRELQVGEARGDFGTPALRSTVLAVVLYFLSTGRHLERRRGHRRLPRPGDALARVHHQGVAALAGAQPLVAGGRTCWRRWRGQGLQAVAEAARVAGVDRALGQRVGLAAEAADALDAAHEAGLDAGARALQLIGGRAVGLSSFCSSSSIAASTLATSTPCLTSAVIMKLLPSCEPIRRGADVVDQLVLVHQARSRRDDLPPPSTCANSCRRSAGRAGRTRPRSTRGRSRACGTLSVISPRLSLACARHVHLRLGHGRAGRDVAEVLRDLLLRGGQVDVAGQHQHRVVRAVPGAEPGLHVVQRGGVEVVHRADGAVVVRVAHRVHGLAQHRPRPGRRAGSRPGASRSGPRRAARPGSWSIAPSRWPMRSDSIHSAMSSAVVGTFSK